MKLRVLTWNIHKAIGGIDRRYRPERVVQVIEHYRPDVVFLQEVDEGCKRSRRDRQVDLLGDELEMPHRAFVPNVKLVRGGQYGNAILSHFPLDEIENVDLTIKPKKRRSALTASAHVHVGGHQRLLVLANVHLGLSGIERGMQLRRLLKSRPFTHHRPSTPFLLGGDFNDVWNTVGTRLLGVRGFRRAGPLLATYPATLPVRSLDGLFVRGDLEPVRLFRSRMRLAREASDHLPLFAELRLPV